MSHERRDRCETACEAQLVLPVHFGEVSDPERSNLVTAQALNQREEQDRAVGWIRRYGHEVAQLFQCEHLCGHPFAH